MSVPFVLLWFLTQVAPSLQLRGVVVDASGAPVRGATVHSGGRIATTDLRGAFVLEVREPEPEVHVHAAGFSEYLARVPVAMPARITLHPAGVSELVTVTAHRSTDRLADTATATTVLPSAILLTSAGLTVDDEMRTVPGFSLFRRSSSRVANPTIQGASLRGLSASGASRALVLADGVPLNDPYGGWVYWNRVPQVAIDRVEIVRGGTTESLYGSQSIGGTVQILMVQPPGPIGRASVEAGQHGQRRVSMYGGTRFGAWSGFAAAERFVLDGFPIVAADERGPVDENAGVRYWSALADLTYSTPRWSLGARANWLDEDRANGTPLQRNDTNLTSCAIRGRVLLSPGALSFAAYGGSAGYDQSFSAIGPGRATETLTSWQRIPSDSLGGSAQWSSLWRTRPLIAGVEFQRASGGGAPAFSGIQRDAAVFAQIAFQPFTRTTLVAGGRAGVWSTTLAESVGFTHRWWYLFPRLSLTWAVRPGASVILSWASPGRAPTMNELYRDFRVGNIITDANPHLGPESARAFESGLLLARGRASMRVVAFLTDLEDAITNVTLGSGDGLIFRQRRNAGHIRARGIEMEAGWQPNRWMSIAGSVTLLDSRFISSAEAGLAGRRVSQVPRWSGACSLRLTPGRAVATFDYRGTGSQFDDDRNVFVLGRAEVFDVYAGGNLARGVQPFVAFENVFNAEVDVGRTPVRTIGTPRSIRAGVRVFWP